MKHTTIAVDIAKNVFELAVSHRPGRVVETHRLSRSRFVPFFVHREPSDVVMEACGMAHYWARQLQQLGHHVVLLPPQYVKPYVQRNKTDRTDAKGLLEALRNKDIRPVPIKTIEQRPAPIVRFLFLREVTSGVTSAEEYLTDGRSPDTRVRLPSPFRRPNPEIPAPPGGT